MTITQPGLEKMTQEALMPPVETSVFDVRADARFWMGVTAMGDHVTMGAEHTAAGIQRANMYIDEHHFLPESARRADGIETDDDDGRSTHFVIVENRLSADGIHRVVATTRLIEKDFEDEPLPVEQLFPEVFEANPAPVGAAEASRFIAHHPDKLTQGALSLSLIRAMTSRSAHLGLEPVYAVVEDHLARLFNKINLPFEQISDYKMLPEYNTENMAIRFDPNRILREACAPHIGQEILQAFFNKSAVRSEGLGYFDETLLTPMPRRRAVA
jgi:N-acyl-L-homoserine lactone synthetase